MQILGTYTTAIYASEHLLTQLLQICPSERPDAIPFHLLPPSHVLFKSVWQIWVLLFQVHNAEQLEKWCLHFISTNYSSFTQLPEFSTLSESDRAYIEKNKWPPFACLQKEIKDSKTTTETVETRRHKRWKCSVM